MRIIDRSLQTVRNLSVIEEEELRMFMAGKAGAPSLLARARLKRYWLACDCRLPAPVMHVALRDDGAVVLKNNPDGEDHAPGCQFMRPANDNTNSQKVISHSIGRVMLGGHTALHSEFQGTGRGNTPQISRSAQFSASHTKALLSMLLTLIEVSELGVYCPARPMTLGDQYAAIRHAAGRFVLHPSIPMDHVLDTRITKQRLVAMAKKLRETSAFGQSRRYGLLMDVIKATGPRRLVLDDGDELDFFGNAEALHGRSTPALALATVTTQSAGSGYFQLGKVAFVPVLSPHHLFPVVDDSDREVVGELFGLLRWLHSKKQIRATASRDIFQVGAGYGLIVRSGAQLLELDLNPSPLDGAPPPNQGVLSLSALGSLDALKKRVAGMIIKGVASD